MAGGQACPTAVWQAQAGRQGGAPDSLTQHKVLYGGMAGQHLGPLLHQVRAHRTQVRHGEEPAHALLQQAGHCGAHVPPHSLDALHESNKRRSGVHAGQACMQGQVCMQERCACKVRRACRAGVHPEVCIHVHPEVCIHAHPEVCMKVRRAQACEEREEGQQRETYCGLDATPPPHGLTASV